MGRKREFLGYEIERTHNTGRLLLDRQILDSQIQSTVERTECRVSLFQRQDSFSLLLSLVHFFGFCFIDGRVDGAGCVCISWSRELQKLSLVCVPCYPSFDYLGVSCWCFLSLPTDATLRIELRFSCTLQTPLHSLSWSFIIPEIESCTWNLVDVSARCCFMNGIVKDSKWNHRFPFLKFNSKIKWELLFLNFHVLRYWNKNKVKRGEWGVRRHSLT